MGRPRLTDKSQIKANKINYCVIAKKKYFYLDIKIFFGFTRNTNVIVFFKSKNSSFQGSLIRINLSTADEQWQKVSMRGHKKRDHSG